MSRIPSPGAAQGDPWAAPVRGLLLDIDDTLVDTQAAMRGSCRVGAAAAWPDRPGEVHERISDVFYDDPGGYFDAYTRGEYAFPEMRAARYHEACRAAGLPETGFETFEAAYREAFARSQVAFDDALAFLDAAAATGVAVGFVTNSGQEQTEVKLDAVGLRGRGPVVTTDTLGVGKPDPAIFTRAMELVGGNREETLVVGDTLPTDVEGGLAAGMRVAWIQRPDRPEPRNAGWGTPVDDPRVRIVAGLAEVTALLGPVVGRGPVLRP
ncbi:HAD family hydrolase [Mobilicoccus pelagius]|uniref:Putative hydrolase n=1 Tax=Mobilicoccus pelagius NBRC 104925 TaxID=1089455 RepID=H5UNH4_9MICO|nr:HAD family hydrolase [Mobilicoccus pelagius]GAB47282.1 putative hydrolase [Mobilicoccus pelagius NBRC 104925]